MLHTRFWRHYWARRVISAMERSEAARAKQQSRNGVRSARDILNDDKNVWPQARTHKYQMTPPTPVVMLPACLRHTCASTKVRGRGTCGARGLQSADAGCLLTIIFHNVHSLCCACNETPMVAALPHATGKTSSACARGRHEGCASPGEPQETAAKDWRKLSSLPRLRPLQLRNLPYMGNGRDRCRSAVCVPTSLRLAGATSPSRLGSRSPV